MNILNVLYVIIIRFIIFHIQNMNGGQLNSMGIVTDADLWLSKYIVLLLYVFSDRKKGFKDYKGIYHAKNVKKHKRTSRKCNYDKQIEINPTWSMYV